jgi:hypothetical protein
MKFDANRKQPEIQDDLDSRKNQEQEFNGDDNTHNVKYQAAKEKNNVNLNYQQ